jgi:predicted RNase H-like HicB family nuclease
MLVGRAHPTPEHDHMKFKVVLEPSDEGGFTVYVPALPGCISEGDTREEALANIQEAIELYLEEEEPFTLPQEAQVVELVL